MKSDDFILLTNSKKSKFLYKHGCFIGKRKSGDITIVLYQIDSFYVEIFYLKHRHTICEIKCSDKLQILDNYLSQVNIDDAMNSLVRLK